MATCVGFGFGPQLSARVTCSASVAAGARSRILPNTFSPSQTWRRSRPVTMQSTLSPGDVCSFTNPVLHERAGRRAMTAVVSAKGNTPTEGAAGGKSDPQEPSSADAVTLQSINELLKSNLAPIQREMANLVETTGDLVEVATRQQIANMFGEHYVRPLLARSLQDLALLLPDETLFKDAESVEVLKAPLERAKRVSKALVKSGGRTPASAQLPGCGRPNRLETEEEQVEELLSCESAGIMLLIAAAFPEIYLTCSPRIMPSEVLELDCRGRMDVDKETNFAYIDTGEVKKSADYAAAVEQLGLRLGALKEFVCAACGTKEDGVRLVGRLFVFEKRSKQFTDINQRSDKDQKHPQSGSTLCTSTRWDVRSPECLDCSEGSGRPVNGVMENDGR
ncbi:hypothetical protein KFL_009020040 [Klebsormidium nitens]|uniref:Uncharacterized protein n=1 Tax=Klebsormidium nitens TaxID=105231 RepID=A0A1Y1IMX3_KLENI|nr:hypothetical protein KFL_009020040 [Klebsormidium nitens]|eukprot:GAQ92003.1 hypothetical protein KFL_009020040 [Klebsormidium nitens]